MAFNLKVDVNRQGFERLRSATDLLVITRGDLQGPVLTRVAQAHRKQEAAIFASEGGQGASGVWPRLSPAYAQRKATAGRAGRAAVKGKKGKARTAALRALKAPISQKILVWSGDMKDRFLSASRPENIEQFVQTSPTGGVFQLGASSTIAGYHFEGGPHLPRRDMVTKTREQVLAIWQAIVDWYRTERLPQVFRAIRLASGTPSQGGAAGRAAAPTP